MVVCAGASARRGGASTARFLIKLPDKLYGDVILVPAEFEDNVLEVVNLGPEDIENRIVEITVKNRTNYELVLPINSIMGNLVISDEAPKDQLSYFDFLAAEEGDVNAPVESYFKLEHLDLEIKTKLIAILRKNESCILTKGKKLGCTHLIEHKVALQPGTKPIARPPYRIPQIHEAEVDSLIQEMVNDGIIEECLSLIHI